MKNIKFTANELLDSFNKELNQMDINEIYKALIAYDLGLGEIDEENDVKLDDIIENDFFGQDYITGFINDDLMNIAREKIIGAKEE